MGEPVTKGAAAWKVRAVAAEAEVERLRSLPVIETCRMCAHCEVGPGRPAPRTPWLPGERRRLVDFCNAKDWRRTVTEADAAPPSWCPWRETWGQVQDSAELRRPVTEHHYSAGMENAADADGCGGEVCGSRPCECEGSGR